MNFKGIAIVGATGSIGQQTLDIVRHFPERLRVVGVAAGTRPDPLLHIVKQFAPEQVVTATTDAQKQLHDLLQRANVTAPRLGAGEDELIHLVTRDDVHMVVMAMVGAQALQPTLAALRAGKDVALATKEVLVAGGEIVMEAARRGGGRLLPLDSEHNAIFQCLRGESVEEVDKLILTASGGPFRQTPAHKLHEITPAEALQHPTWSMGAKVTIDSATLMNKGLEVIEARWLFDLPLDQIDVVVHPQSVLHSCVEFVDGSILAHMGPTDMRIPIQHVLFYPERRPGVVQRLSLSDVGSLTFEQPDRERFPALDLAYEASNIGGTMPAVLNAANEVAVQLFLEGRIGFTDIPRTVKQVMARHEAQQPKLEHILAADGWARQAMHSIGAAAL